MHSLEIAGQNELAMVKLRHKEAIPVADVVEMLGTMLPGVTGLERAVRAYYGFMHACEGVDTPEGHQQHAVELEKLAEMMRRPS